APVVTSREPRKRAIKLCTRSWSGSDRSSNATSGPVSRRQAFINANCAGEYVSARSPSPNALAGWQCSQPNGGHGQSRIPAVILAQSSREQEPTRFVSRPQRDALAPLAVLLKDGS